MIKKENILFKRKVIITGIFYFHNCVYGHPDLKIIYQILCTRSGNLLTKSPLFYIQTIQVSIIRLAVSLSSNSRTDCFISWD